MADPAPRPRAGVRAALPAAAGGLLAGHVLTYLLISPNAAQRHALLHHTGHGYLPKAIAAGAALGALAVAVVAGRGIARRHVRAGGPIAWAGFALRLAVMQALGFALVEVSERLAVGAPLRGLSVILPTGLAVEAIVAAVLAALLCLTDRAAGIVACAVAGRGTPPHARRASRRQPRPVEPERTRPVVELVRLSVALRGPPAPSPV